ncbi:MAG: cell wall-binding repeat-containing protein, partial [Ilumatobacteraceae bacterium]
MRRALSIVLLVVAAVWLPSSPVTAIDTPPPAAWPSNDSVRPRIEAGPHSLRFYGDNRYQTALAATLLLRGSGSADSYPFGNPDPATSRGWWGLGTCPRSIIVVAGDNPADALAANTLSDPTGSSTEPYLQRSAAADPLFFPPGGFARVDTDFAPVLTTTSARDGATQLDIATRLAAQDLSRGGCNTAKQAIIVGGVRAIASTVEAELVSIGYDEVFRVAGSSRYQTARLVAEALGTAAVPGSPARTSCIDCSSRNGARTSFYANSVIEYRESVDSCRVLGRTVVLADGADGIDALASGWWTSYWQVPILLTNGTSALPVQTREALLTLDVDTLIVLGGEARIPQQVVDHAMELTGASTQIRVAGDDRYATSVEMARRFGGWWSTGNFADASGSALCVAASSGGSGGAGWPDALSAGPWCARMAVARASLGAPARAVAPIDGGSGAISTSAVDGGLASHRMSPMVLVPSGSTPLPASVAGALTN